MFGANGAALVIGANIGGKLPNRKALAIGVFAFVMAALYTIAVLIIQPYWLFVELVSCDVVINGHYIPGYFFFSHGE